jgi:thiosulfate reductase/polysulfide reductase chain A
MSEIINLKRRNFLKGSAAAAAGIAAASTPAFAFNPYEDALDAKEKKENEIKNAKFIPSVCGMCVNMCGVIARRVDEKVVKLDPNPLYTKSRNFMCARGNAGIAAVYDPDRLKWPLIRVGEKGSGQFRKATWEEAYDYIAKKMVKILDEEKDNRSTFAFGAGASTGNMGDPIFANFLNGVGSANFVDHFTTCFAPSFMANKLIFGSWGVGDFERTKYVLNLGANRAEGIVTPDTLDTFRRTHGRGIEKYVYIDVRYTDTAAHADEFIVIKPGTDGALMLAMIWETINKGYHKTPYKADYLSKNVSDKDLKDLEDFFTKGEASKYTPEWAANITEIPADTIRRLTKEFSDAAEKYKGAANCYRSRKSTWYYQDFEFRRAQAIFNVLHGTVNRPGGILLGRGLQLESYDYEDFPIYDNAKTRIDIAKVNNTPGEYPLANPTKGSWQVFREAVLDINKRWRNGEKLKDWEYPIRGMFIYKQNPMQSVPDYNKTAEMFKSMDLVVVIDIIANDTAYYADVILPDVSYLERESLVKQFGTLPEPLIAWRSQAMLPMYGTKTIYSMMKELSERIEKPFASITFKYTWSADDLGAELPKDFDLSKYLNDDFTIDKAKLTADIKDPKLVKAILEHASEDDLGIQDYKISKAFDKPIHEFNEEVMKEIYGEEAAKIAKEYGAYWPGIEDAIKDGIVDEHTKALKKDYPDKNRAPYEIYKKYSKLKNNPDGTPYYIVPKKGKWISIALRNLEGKPFKNPITGQEEKLGMFPKWRDSLYQNPKENEVRIVLGRHAYYTQSADVNNYLLLDLMNYNYIWINDELAKKLNLKFKDDVVLVNRDGTEIKAKVYPTKKIRKDTAFIATGFGSKSKLLTLGYDNGISQAEVCDNSIDPIIGSSSMNETFVTIRKV